MSHRHRHEAPAADATLDRAFRLGILLNVAFVAVEAAAGLAFRSMGLLSDAGHNLSDVAGLLLAMLAFRLARRPASPRYTYGYRKGTILISLLNALLLFAAVGAIAYECIARLRHPAPTEGAVVAWTAAAGVAINGFTAWLFLKERKRDLNVRGAFLHMAADALVSVGVVISGVAIALTGRQAIDPIVGLVVAAVIVASAWSLTRDSLRLALDGVPEGIDPGQVARRMASTPGVISVHHLHIWALSTTETALTAHVVLAPEADSEAVKHRIREQLAEAGIRHATLETEPTGSCCDQPGE